MAKKNKSNIYDLPAVKSMMSAYEKEQTEFLKDIQPDPPKPYWQKHIIELEDKVRWYKETGLQMAVISVIVAFSFGVYIGAVIK